VPINDKAVVAHFDGRSIDRAFIFGEDEADLDEWEAVLSPNWDGWAVDGDDSFAVDGV